MPSSSRSRLAAAAQSSGLDAAAVAAADVSAADAPHKYSQRVICATSMAEDAPPAEPAAAFAAAATHSNVNLVEKKLQLCSAADICLIKGTVSALASASLEPQVVQQLCRSLPHDLLKDFPPSLLLLLHEQQQQRHQKDEAEQTSLLWGLAAALQKRCSGWKGTPFCAAQSAPATDVKAASTEGAASVPDFAVAVLEAQTKILHKLREALLEPLTDSMEIPEFGYVATGQLARHVLELLRHSCSTNTQQRPQQVQQLQQQLRNAYYSCRCLIPSSPCDLLSHVLACVLKHHVLLLHPQVMPLSSGLVAAAADVAVLLHCSSSSSSSSSSSQATWCPLSDEQLLQAGRELLAAATHLFPSEYFQQQLQVLPQEGTLRNLLLKTPKSGGFPPINAINPQLISRPLNDRQDAWIDLLQQLLLLQPPGQPRMNWVVAAGLDVLLLQLLLRSSLPLIRPLLLPLLLDSCGVDLELDQLLQEQQQLLQSQQPLSQEEHQLQQKFFFAAAGAKALRDGLYIVASVTFVERLAGPAARPAAPAAPASRPHASVQQPSPATFFQTSSSSNEKDGGRGNSRMCVFKQVARALGSRSRHSNSPSGVVADVLELLLLATFQGDGAAPGSSNNNSSGHRHLQAALLDLVDHTTAAAAEAAAAVGASGDMPGLNCGCGVSAHLFGALLLLSCPQQWACDRLCSLACSSVDNSPSLLLQPDCLIEAVSLMGDAPRRFVCKAATHLLLLQQQPQQEQQQEVLRACACLIDMYDPCLLEECSRALQQQGRSSCLLQQQERLYHRLLLQRLFSVSLHQRQSAAASLKRLLQLSGPLLTDPVGTALRLCADRKQEQQRQVCGQLLDETEVQLLCAAAANRRLCAATRTESLDTLQVYVYSSHAHAMSFLRNLCCSLLAALPEYLPKGGTAAAAAVAAASAAVTAAEVGAASCSGAEEPLLLSMLELLRRAVQSQEQLQELLQHQELHAHQQQQDQYALLAGAARVLSLPLLLLPPGDPLLHPILEVYWHLLGDALVLLCFSKPENLSLALLQLCAALLFHPQQSLLLAHRCCSVNPQVEALLRDQQPQQHVQHQRQQPRLLLPTWLSLRVELPMETATFSCFTAAQAAWASRSEDLAFLVASQLVSDRSALNAAAAAAAAAYAAAGDNTARPPQESQPGIEDRSKWSSPSSGASSAIVDEATTAAAAAATECSVCLCRSQPVYLESAFSEPSPVSTNNKTELSLVRLSLSRKTVQQLLMPAHPTLNKLLCVLSHPPLLQGSLPPLRLQQQRLGDSCSSLPTAAAASSPPPAAAGSNPPSDAATYAEALHCCRKIAAALQLPGDSAAASFCCLRRRGLAAAAETARWCCCCSLSLASAKGLRAVAVAVKRYTYPYLQELAQQVAETMLGGEEQTAAATGAGWGELVEQQPASGGAAALCSNEIDLLLRGTQLLTELLPLAAVAAAPAGAGSGGRGNCCRPCNRSIIGGECECCSKWLELPNLSQFCGSLLGVSMQLPLLRRAALQLAAVSLPHSLPPRPCSSNRSTCLVRAQIDDLLTLRSGAFATGLSNSGSSSVLLQLQLQQLLQLHSRSTAQDEASMQEQRPLANALESLNACIVHNSFGVVAAAAAQAAAEWQELAATGTAGIAQDHYQINLLQQQVQQQQQQEQALLETQVKLMLSFIRKAHPEVRVAAWRCLGGCLQMATGLLQQHHQLHLQEQDLLLRVYSWTCSEICYRLLRREGMLPGGFCCCCSSSCREVAEALQCLSTLRWSSRCSSNGGSKCGSGISKAGTRGGCPASVAAAAAALDEWVASDSFVHRTFAAFLTCNSSSSSTLGAVSYKTQLKGLIAALELLCCSAEDHVGPLLQLLQQPQKHLQHADQTGIPSCTGSSSILSNIVAAVCPQSHPMVMLPAHIASQGAAFSATAAAAVAAVGTQDAAPALTAAANALAHVGGSVCIQEITKCCRALQLLLTLLDGTDALGPLLGNSNSAAADDAPETTRAGTESFLLLGHVERLVQAATMLLLGPFRSNNGSCSCCCGEELENWQDRRNAAAAAPAVANGRCTRVVADIVHELLLLMLRLFVALHEHTALQVANQLQGETSVLLLLLQHREELKRQRQEQQQLDNELLQTLQGAPQKARAGTAAAAAAAAQRAAAEYLWASPSLWLFIVLCLQPACIGTSSSFGVPREAAALAVCLLRLSYDSSLKYFISSEARMEVEELTDARFPFSSASPILLPPLLPPLPHGHLQMYRTKDTQQQQQQQQQFLIPTDPRMAVGLFTAAASLLLQQLRCRSLAAACAVSIHQRIPPSSRRHSTAGTAGAAAASPTGSSGRGRSKAYGLLSPSPKIQQHRHQRRPSSSCCSSPMNASKLSAHCTSRPAAAGTNPTRKPHQQEQHDDFVFCNDFSLQQQALLLQQNRQEYRNSCLLHALGELLLLLFAGHPTAATAASWTRFIFPTENSSSSSRKPEEPLLLTSHLVAALECLLHGAPAASLLNFTSALGGQRLQQKGPSLGQQLQQQRDDGVVGLGSLLSVSNCGRSCGNLLLHRVLLLLQLLSAACTCTPDGFAAAAAAAASLPFGAVVAAVSALWRLCSMQQTLLSLLLQFLHRCISARQQISLLGAPSSGKTDGVYGLLLLETGEALLRHRLQEAGVVAALVDSVCNSLSSNRNRQQKLPPRLLRSVLILLQHTLGSSVEAQPLMQLIEVLAASLRPRLHQLLQRNNNGKAAAAGAAGSTRLRWSLNPVDMLLLSAQLDCLGAAAAAAATAGDRRCLAPLFSNGPSGSSYAKGGPFAGSDKESIEDFVAPLLLPDIPLQLVAALLRFLVSLTAATAATFEETTPGEPVEVRLARPQAVDDGVCVSPRKSTGHAVPRAAARTVLLLQHTPVFHDALFFLFMVRLSPQAVLPQVLHSSGREAPPQQQQQHWGGALRDALLLLLHVFLSDFRPASRLKQHGEPLLAALQDWTGVLLHELQLQMQLEHPQQQQKQLLILPLLHEIRHLLLRSVRALSTLGAHTGTQTKCLGAP